MTFDILLSSPDVGELEQEYVLRAMRSGWVAPAGPDLEAFEREVAERVGVAHAVAVSSGTAALHLALVSWGIGPGDVVVTSTLTFAATANAIRYVGAEPHFVDVDLESGNMDPELLRQALDDLEGAGKRVPAAIPVDLLGKCADYTAIEKVLAGRGIRMLCDAAESFGASHAGRPAGSIGDAAVLSFNGNKIMTTSGGGMLLTDDGDMAAHVRKLSTQAREPVLHYEHKEVGYNYRLSNISAAIGRAQLARLGEMLGRRREWREGYRAVVDTIPGVRILGGELDREDSCWLTALVLDETETGWSARGLIEALAADRVETRPVWKPMHEQPVFKDARTTQTGHASTLYRHGITLPSGSSLTNAQFDRVVDRLVTRLRQAA